MYRLCARPSTRFTILALFLVAGLTLGSRAQAQERGVGVAAQGERRIALVIGNSDYAESPLSNPVNDARLLAAALREVGFEVIERSNTSQSEMKSAIRDFGVELQNAGVDTVGLFFFAGHGLQVAGENYLVPTDASITREADVSIAAVPAQVVLEQMAYAGNRLNLIVLDACRNNPYKRSFRSAGSGLARMDAPTGSLVAYSTSPGKVAMDGEGENSPYARALAEAIRQPGLRVEDVFKRTRRQVLEQTDDFQVPWESSSLLGDFYFRGDAVSAADRPVVKEPKPGDESSSELADCRGCPEMISILGGSFEMGSTRGEVGRAATEGPTRSVTLAPFDLSRHEITVAQFRTFVERSGYEPAPGCWRWGFLWKFDQALSWRTPGFDQTDDHPVTCVRHVDAVAYAEWLSAETGQSYRLPTEAEWEYAARAGSTSARPWGDDPSLACRYANVYDQTSAAGSRLGWAAHACDDGFVATAPVGSFEANAYGVHDMIGNVWEWVQDCDGPYRDAPGDGSAATDGKCKKRVLRGGDYNEDPSRLRSAVRHSDQPVDGTQDYGFRVARSPIE